MAEALYNKYRPQIFEDVVGQEHIERTLKNAIANDKISHAYMFTGPRGTGKTTTARLLAKALLCQQGPTPDPDGTCEDCELVANGEHPDVYELDAASRTGVENVREEIIGKVNYAPTRGRYKIYIIDEVHMLSTAAFNALLKTLEEPPSHVVFVLCTTDPQKVPETIQSRCQRFDFRRISSEELISRLGAICEMEGVHFDGDALDLIAHRANGGMRDALTSLDQLIAFGGGDVTIDVAERLLGSLDSSELAEIVEAIGKRDAAACFRWTSQYMETGADLVHFVQELTSHMRDMYVMSLAGADVALEVTEAGRRELESESVWYGPDRLARMLTVLGDLAQELKTSTNQRLSFEIALTRLVRPDGDLTLAALAERIEQLERGVQSASPASAGSAPISPVVGTTETAPVGVTSAETTFASKPVQQPIEQKPSQQIEQPIETPAVGSVEKSASEPVVHQTVQQVVRPVDLGNIDVSRLWASTLAHLKKIGAAYGVLFMSASASIEDGALKIAFPADTEFSYKAAQKQDARDALEKALAQSGVQGIPYTFSRDDSRKPEEQSSSRHSGMVQEPSNPAPAGPDARIGGTKHLDPAPSARNDEQVASVQNDARAVSSQNDEQTANARGDEFVMGAQNDKHEVSVQNNKQAIGMQSNEQAANMSLRDSEETVESTPAEKGSQDADFADFLTAAFGENVVIEEVD